MYSVFVVIMVIASLIVLLLLPKIGSNVDSCDVRSNWQGVWKERLKIDN